MADADKVREALYLVPRFHGTDCRSQWCGPGTACHVVREALAALDGAVVLPAAHAETVRDAVRSAVYVCDQQTQMLRTLPFDSAARVRLRDVEQQLAAALALLCGGKEDS